MAPIMALLVSFHPKKRIAKIIRKIPDTPIKIAVSNPNNCLKIIASPLVPPMTKWLGTKKRL